MLSISCLFYVFFIKKAFIYIILEAIDSPFGGHTDMRPVLLEPVRLEEVPSGKVFLKSDQWPNYRKKVTPLMLFNYGEILVLNKRIPISGYKIIIFCRSLNGQLSRLFIYFIIEVKII